MKNLTKTKKAVCKVGEKGKSFSNKIIKRERELLDKYIVDVNSKKIKKVMVG